MFEPDPNPKLTALCDEKTLQEDERGFFKSLVENIVANSDIQRWTKDVFPNTYSGYEYVKNLVTRNKTQKTIMEIMTVTEVYRKKDEREATANIVKAEMLLKNDGDVKEIMALCCRAVIKSSQPSSALRLRAICLMNQRKSILAVRDLEYALKYLEIGPKKEYHKILKKNIEEQLASIKKSDLYKEQSSCENSDSNQIKKETSETFPLHIGLDNIQGRYVIAGANINPGDTVLEEKPYATCLKSQFFGSYCHHCLDKLEATVGCSECSSVAFCSEKCKQQATNTYHKYECKFMDLFIGSGMSVLCNLALRMLTQIGLEKSLEIFDTHFKEEGDDKNCKIYDRTTENGKIATIYSFNTHEKSRVHDDYIKRVLMAVFLTRCLQGANFFSSSESKKDKLSMSEEEIRICSMLLYNIQMLEFNAHEIKPRGGPRETGIACAVYATAALFNHDCISPIARYFKGSTLILRSVRPVALGSPIGDNYGPRYGVRSTNNSEGQHSTSGRRRILRSRYRFYCQCDACQQDWPDVDQLEDQPAFRCDESGCGGRISDANVCEKCGLIYSVGIIKDKCGELMSCLIKYEEGRELRSTDRESGMKKLGETLSRFHNMALHPHKPTLDAEDCFNKCMAAVY